MDVNKVSLQAAAKKETLITQQNQYDQYLNLVKESIRYKAGQELQPQLPSIYEGVVIDFEPDYIKFNTQSRTAKTLKLLEDKSFLEVDKYANELLPSINLITGYSLEGENHGIKNNDQTVYAGISMDWPLPRTVEQARYKSAKIDLKKAKLSSENIHIRLKTNLKNLNDQIQREKELIAIAWDKINFAQAIVEDERKNYSLGRVTLNTDLL